MEDGIIVAIAIAGILQLVSWIVFFVMAANVSALKKHLTTEIPPIEKFMSMAKEEMYIGNEEKAREYLLRAKYLCDTTYKNHTNVVINGVWQDRSKVISKIDAMLDGKESNDQLQYGTLVVYLTTGDQMKLGEKLEDGRYKCYRNGVSVGPYDESEIMEFEKWRTEIYCKKN